MCLIGRPFGFVCASPAPIGMVIADIALKSAGVELIKTLRPDSGTSHSNEVIIIFTGEASAVKPPSQTHVPQECNFCVHSALNLCL